MTPTWIGMLMLLIGALLLIRGSVLAMLVFVMASLLFGGSSAIDLPALGGSSIQPAYVALGFLMLRIALSGGGVSNLFVRSLSQNWALMVFSLYGIATALVLPRIFRGAMEVTAMRFTYNRDPFAAQPLQPSSQNVTAAVYLFGTLLGAVGASIVARSPRASYRLAGAFAWLTFAHVALGMIALVLTQTHHPEIIALFRNASYAQLDQSYAGFIRITGFFPEASAYALVAFPLLILCLESWMRGVRPRLMGAAAIAMGLTLAMSTSSSAYLSLAAYMLILVVRFMLFPSAIPARRILILVISVFITILVGLTVAVALPQLLDAFADMLSRMTVKKANSYSGLQRQFWARQGIEAFQKSYGLGIGAGSFRSSSLGTAIAGSMGVVGLASFAIYNWTVLKPLRASTFNAKALNMDQAFGASCGWAAVAGLIPAMAATPVPDPGLLFAILAGLAVTWRADAVPALRQTQQPARPQSIIGPVHEGATP